MEVIKQTPLPRPSHFAVSKPGTQSRPTLSAPFMTVHRTSSGRRSTRVVPHTGAHTARPHHAREDQQNRTLATGPSQAPPQGYLQTRPLVLHLQRPPSILVIRFLTTSKRTSRAGFRRGATHVFGAQFRADPVSPRRIRPDHFAIERTRRLTESWSISGLGPKDCITSDTNPLQIASRRLCRTGRWNTRGSNLDPRGRKTTATTSIREGLAGSPVHLHV